MLWLNFLHIYQPADSENKVIEEATEKSYLRIISALEKNPAAKFTMNITGCLIERWKELHYAKLLGRVKKLVERGQIELTGSVSHHCLVPLTPKKEVARQIKENTRILKETFGEELKLRGFFLPEMAYSPEAAKIIKSYGFQWIILDEICHAGQLGEVDFSKVYRDRTSGLKVVFRSRKFSSCYVPKMINKKYPYQELLLTATDGELYGLHYRDADGELEESLKNPGVKTAAISEFIDSRQRFFVADLVSGNWEATEEAIAAGSPYILWFDKENEIHSALWGFVGTVFSTLEKYRYDNKKWIYYHLSRGLASCTFWWASGHDFRPIFGPVAWNPDMIERGLDHLMRAVRSIDNKTSGADKIKAENECSEIKKMIWKKHWEKYWLKK